ncbi:hypothetical protein LWI28_017076 [Acer negundo]|uniref:RNase H type-1 domain-containing protein n=1 Tax=Acer negundo TaxID=4023 RepID=A0AAD5I6J2_ACENE|nr:hypothetical protein LWI28_017076 [Acer negundo]
MPLPISDHGDSTPNIMNPELHIYNDLESNSNIEKPIHDQLESSSIPQDRPVRSQCQPEYLKDYICSTVTSTTCPHPIVSHGTGAGIILRDQNAKFKAAYAAPVRNCNRRLEAELVGLKHGLIMAIRHGVDYLEIEGDYLIEMQVLAGEQIIPSSANINKHAKKCSYLLKQFRSVKISQVDFDSNQGANEVATIGIDLKKRKKWLAEPPSNISGILITDVIGHWIYKPMP